MKLQFYYNLLVGSMICLLILCVNERAQAQKKMGLEECIALALQRNVEIQNTRLNEAIADVNYRQAVNRRYPTLNANTSFGYNFGRTIDPSSNSFENQTSRYQTVGLNTGVNLFQGGVVRNTIEQSVLSQQAAQYRTEAVIDNIGLQMAQNYLNVLIAQEAQKLAEIQKSITQEQINRINKLIDAGSVPANDRLNLEAQLVRDEQQVISAQNQYELALLSLKNALLMDIDEALDIEPINLAQLAIDEQILDMPVSDVYSMALSFQPGIKADSIDYEVAKYDKKISEGRLMPTVSLGGSLSTNYSNLAQKVTGSDLVYNDLPIIINGNTVDVGFPSQSPRLANTPYSEQLENNLGYGFGVTLQVPIYNGNSARLNVERSTLAMRQRENQQKINQQALKANVLTAVTQARLAKQTLLASEKSVEAQQINLTQTEKSMKAGRANNFDFLTAKNNLSVAENNLLQARYDYIFRLKVIDFYLGKPLKL